ncbi:hypothetical protein ACFS07_00065 [Undibacterium arcticum]
MQAAGAAMRGLEKARRKQGGTAEKNKAVQQEKEVDEKCKAPHNLTSSQLTDTTLRQAVAALAANRSLTINSR